MYSKHVRFTLPFGWYNDKINNPNPSRLFKIYGKSESNADFSQFKQLPYVETMLTVTPVLSVKWPDYGLLKSKIVKTTPVWIHRHSIQKRDLTDKFKKFFQLTLYCQLPVILTGVVKVCSETCPARLPMDLQLQVSLGNFKAGLTGLGLSAYFSIPIKLSTPKISICLPYLFSAFCPGTCQNQYF